MRHRRWQQLVPRVAVIVLLSVGVVLGRQKAEWAYGLDGHFAEHHRKLAHSPSHDTELAHRAMVRGVWAHLSGNSAADAGSKLSINSGVDASSTIKVRTHSSIQSVDDASSAVKAEVHSSVISADKSSSNVGVQAPLSIDSAGNESSKDGTMAHSRISSAANASSRVRTKTHWSGISVVDARSKDKIGAHLSVGSAGNASVNVGARAHSSASSPGTGSIHVAMKVHGSNNNPDGVSSEDKDVTKVHLSVNSLGDASSEVPSRTNLRDDEDHMSVIEVDSFGGTELVEPVLMEPQLQAQRQGDVAIIVESAGVFSAGTRQTPLTLGVPIAGAVPVAPSLVTVAPAGVAVASAPLPQVPLVATAPQAPLVATVPVAPTQAPLVATAPAAVAVSGATSAPLAVAPAAATVGSAGPLAPAGSTDTAGSSAYTEMIVFVVVLLGIGVVFIAAQTLLQSRRAQRARLARIASPRKSTFCTTSQPLVKGAETSDGESFDAPRHQTSDRAAGSTNDASPCSRLHAEAASSESGSRKSYRESRSGRFADRTGQVSDGDAIGNGASSLPMNSVNSALSSAKSATLRGSYRDKYRAARGTIKSSANSSTLSLGRSGSALSMGAKIEGSNSEGAADV